MTNNEFYKLCDDEAAAGDGHFAIARALLDLTYAVRALGTGDAASPMGAIEFLASQVNEAGHRIAGALGDIQQAMPG